MQGEDLELVSDVARDLVAQLAPEELPVFPAFRREFVRGRLGFPTSGSHDQVLGFGVEGIVAPLTPVVLLVLLEVVKRYAGEVGTDLARGSVATASALLRRVLGRPAEAADAAAPLSGAQLAEVHRVALGEARRLRLSDERSSRLADAITTMLALAGTAEDGSHPGPA